MTSKDDRLAALVAAVKDTAGDYHTRGNTVTRDEYTARLTALLADALTPPADADTAALIEQWVQQAQRQASPLYGSESFDLIATGDRLAAALRARAVPPGGSDAD